MSALHSGWVMPLCTDWQVQSHCTQQAGRLLRVIHAQIMSKSAADAGRRNNQSKRDPHQDEHGWVHPPLLLASGMASPLKVPATCLMLFRSGWKEP